MKKLILIVGLFALVGCSSTQDKIDVYKEKRDVIANTFIKTHNKKECIKSCNQLFNLGLDRANCKAKCMVK